MLQIQCPSCARVLRLPETMLGQQVRCPLCNNIFLVGGQAQPVPAVTQAHRPPSAVASPPASEFAFDQPGGPTQPRHGPEQEFDFQEAHGGMAGIRSRTVGRRGAAAMQLAFAFNLLAYIFFVLLQFLAPTPMVTKVIWIGLVTIFFLVPVVFIQVGAGQLSSGRGQGLVITGCIMAFIAALELLLYSGLTGIVLLAAIGTGGNHPMFLFAFLFVLWCIAALIVSILGGIRGLVALGHREPRYEDA